MLSSKSKLSKSFRLLNVWNIADELLSEVSSVNEKDAASRSVVKKVGFNVLQKLFLHQLLTDISLHYYQNRIKVCLLEYMKCCDQ